MALGIMPGEHDWERIFGRDPYGRVPGVFGGMPQMPQMGGFAQLATNPAITLGLGLLAGRERGMGFGEGALGAVQGYQDVMDRSFRNTMLNRRFEREEREAERQQKAAERAERQTVATTAGRISSGIGQAQDPMAYWRLVSGMPEVSETLQAYGVDPASIQTPEQLAQLQQQLSAASQVGTPGAQPDYTDDQREYMLAQQQGYGGSFFDYLRDLKKAGAPSVSVNTDKSLYGTLAEKQAQQYSELYTAAQSAPEAIARTQRVRQILQRVPYTGAGAEYKLAVGKAAKAVGFNYAGDDLANTEALMTEMARSTLDSIKSSGLAGSQGLTEGERKFLQDAVAGRVSLEPATIERLAELNERAARLTLNRWNETASRLDQAQLRTLGMVPVAQPAPRQGGSVGGRLTRNPDGSYTYTP